MMRIFFSILFISNICLAFAQQLFLPNNQSYQYLDRYLYSSDNRFHTSIKPYLSSQTDSIVLIDTLIDISGKRKFFNHILNKHIVEFKKDVFSFSVDPLFNIEYGKNTDTNSLSTINTRGIQVDGSITTQFSFHTAFYENQAFFPDYRSARIKSLQRTVVPGQCLPKEFKSDGYDYAYAEGYVSYTTQNSIFNFQFGHGKNFIGDGYRSLLLSDNSYNYPFLKITTDIWNIKYVNLWAQFQDVSKSTENGGFEKKWGAFHYLDWSVTKWLNIAFFEAIIWQNQDSTGYRGFDMNYANPVIFFRPVEFSVGSPDNALMGISGKITLWKNTVLYSQLLLDEFKLDELKANTGWWGNKYGIQAGMKLFDVFKLQHFDLQGEVNVVRPFTYSHRSNTQNYGHYAQPLAHPLGANFEELVCFMKYNYKRIFIEGRFSYAMHGLDTAGINYGNNIFKDYTTRLPEQEYGNYLGQGLENSLIITDLNISYLINPMSNMNIALGITNRRQENDKFTTNDMLLYFAFRTSLQNFYYDF